jgi:NAD-dependent deacetylase
MKRGVIFSGAGLSADSGINTFRDPDGLWEQHKVEDVAYHEAWWDNKELVLSFYQMLYRKYEHCQPHEGHHALARLQQKYDVAHVTQNADRLLEKAGCGNVLHLHGTLDRKKCERHKSVLSNSKRFQCDYLCDANGPVVLGDLCPKCGGQMRPDVVWFGEAVDLSFDQIEQWCHDVAYSDGVFICVGTSGQVQPAASLIAFFSQVKNKFIVDINPQDVADYDVFRGPAKEQLPILVDRILERE